MTDTPIAIVGISAMFAGSTDAAGFWRDIVAGRDLLSEVPPSHWSLDDYYDPDPKVPDRTYGRRGSFLGEVDFDPMEFGIPPKILSATDSSQLLALIVARQLMNDAVGAFDVADHQKVGVVLGASTTELCLHMSGRLQAPVWERAMREAGLDPEVVDTISDRVSDMYVPWDESTFPGLLGNVVSGRVANRFDFAGPNCVVDAACASSLAALQSAVGELQLGRADLMISGGVDALNDVLMFTCFSQTGALSPTGDCRPFSAAADGTMLAEGLAMFALKRLDDAERDGDAIYAVIRGIGASSDGRAKSIFAPRREGQALALRRAYEAAGYTPRTVGLLEAHGTGTRAGDVAETSAARDVFEEDSQGEPWCALGSVKSQIGHAKAAAGAAGMFKAVMSLHHAVLPPTIKIGEPNPNLDLETSPFYLNNEPRPWIHGASHPRRASVSAFGFGGTNYHVALEEYRGAARPRRRRATDSELIVLSADTPSGLVERCRELAGQLDDRTLVSVAWRTQQDWEHRSARLAIVATDLDDLADKLNRTADTIERRPGLELDAFDVHYATGDEAPDVVLRAGGGEGARPSMGAALAMHFDAARAVWDAVAALDGPAAAIAGLVHGPPALDDAMQQARVEALQGSPWVDAAALCAARGAVDLLQPALETTEIVGVDDGPLDAFVEGLESDCAPQALDVTSLSEDAIVVDLGPGDAWARSIARQHPERRVVALDAADGSGVRPLWNALGALVASGVAVDFDPFWHGYLPVESPDAGEKPKFAVSLTGTTYGKPRPAEELQPAQPRREPVSSRAPMTATDSAPDVAPPAEPPPEGDAYVRFQQEAARAHIEHLQTLAAGSQLSPSAPAAMVLDPRVDQWLNDHCPTFTRPALPMMSVVDAMAGAALAELGGVVAEIRDVEVSRWIAIDGPTRVETYVEPGADGWADVWLSVGPISAPTIECVATGRVRCAPQWERGPASLEPLRNARPLEDPYRTGRLFHGPSFQVLQRAVSAPGGASGLLTAHPGPVPVGVLNPALLDGAIHVIPYDELETWSPQIPRDCLAYPNRVDWLTLHGPTPTDGPVTVEVRLDGIQHERFPSFRMQFRAADRLWADMRLTEILVPKGRLGRGDPAARRAFLRDRQFVPGLGLSRFEGQKTRLSIPEIRKNNWFQGTVEAIYDVHGDLREQARQAVIKDHLASRLRCHPSRIVVEEGSSVAFLRDQPGRRYATRVEMDGPMTFVARDPG